MYISGLLILRLHSIILNPCSSRVKRLFVIFVNSAAGFSEQEVTSMSRALALFGASLQAVMVRSSKPDKKLWATTHLVCATDKSNGKLEAAKRWKIPAVTVNGHIHN